MVLGTRAGGFTPAPTALGTRRARLHAPLQVLWAVTITSGVSAQNVRLSVFATARDYREQSAALAFAGKGGSARLDLSLGRMGVSVTGARISLERSAAAAPDAEPFSLSEVDAAVRFRVVSIVSVEAGGFRRWVDPEPAAQSVSAGRIGIRADYRLAPGADAGIRAGFVGGARFSGGGTAKRGLLLGFGLSYGAARRGVRLTADYDFLRIDRETAGPLGTIAVPIQSHTARLGLALLL